MTYLELMLRLSFLSREQLTQDMTVFDNAAQEFHTVRDVRLATDTDVLKKRFENIPFTDKGHLYFLI